MIVSPEFVECWEMRTLVRLLGNDEAAPVYVLRLWSHCQTRNDTFFDMTPDNLAAACRYAGGDAKQFEAALIECRYVKRTEQLIEVLHWADDNKALIAARANGSKGGRPKKTSGIPPAKEDKKTHGLTQSATGLTHGLTDKSRGDKSRKTKTLNPLSASPTAGSEVEDLGPLPPSEPAAPSDPPPNNVVELKPQLPADEVFAYWQSVMGHPRAKLGDGDRKKINERLTKDGFTVQDLKDAVDGCKASPHHMGQNDTRTVYDSMELIFRNTSKVNSFIALKDKPPRNMRGAAAKLTGANYQRGI